MLWILLHLKKFTFLVCPPGLSVFSLPFKTGQKRLPYFPEALLFVLVLLVVSFFFQLRCLGFLRENGFVVCWGPVSNGRMMIFKMSFRQSKSPDFQHGHM